MICDDSAVIRAAIGRILEADPGILVVARASNGQAALDAQKLHDIDVVVLDIEMPVMDGLTALPLLLAADPGLRVIMASTLTTRGADVSMRALRLGAADYVPKPSAMQVAGDSRFGTELIEKVKGLARQRRYARTGDAAAVPASARPALPALRAGPKQSPLLLAIGSSTGGPNALFTLVQALSAKIAVPVVLTQHMPATFIPILAEHIDKLGVLPCAEARDGARLQPGRILVAPGNHHMLIKRDSAGLMVRLSDTPPVNYCRPAVDPMLQSAGEATGGRVLAVILTGMGQDGLEGVRDIVTHGGAALAQDEASSVVWGMPGAVARAGLAHAVLPLSQLGPKILAMLGTRA
jgi:two-component system, chemotaxis family, protein-glutamate methylesterase/glutaminase